MTLQWIPVKKDLPHDDREVQVVVWVYDYQYNKIPPNNCQRLISTGKFYAGTGWWIRNGYMKVSYPPGKGEEIYNSVLFWKDFDSETETIFKEQGRPE